MKKLLLLIMPIVLFFGCSKDTNPIIIKDVIYDFKPIYGNIKLENGADIEFFSHRENKTISLNINDRYSYNDKVKIGDRVTLKMSTIDIPKTPFTVMVSVQNYGAIIISDERSATLDPYTVKIDKVLKAKYFEFEDE